MDDVHIKVWLGPLYDSLVELHRKLVYLSSTVLKEFVCTPFGLKMPF